MQSQLPVQSVPITTNVVSSNPAHGDVYSMQHYVMKFVFDRSVVFSRYSSFLHQQNWLPRYNWNIVESGIKRHNTLNSKSVYSVEKEREIKGEVSSGLT